MSYFMSAKLPVLERRQDGRKGHYHDESEGNETLTGDSNEKGVRS